MLKYVCFWKLRNDAGEEARRLVRQYLSELPRRVGWVRSWSWGEAMERSGEGFTHGFTAEFDDEAALEGYLTHPDRLAIEERVRPLLAESLSACYETP